VLLLDGRFAERGHNAALQCRLRLLSVGQDTNARANDGTLNTAPVGKYFSGGATDCATHDGTLQVRINVVAGREPQYGADYREDEKSSHAETPRTH
jgi:hypothetical protein